jgi:hypothetical protein
MAQPAAYIPVLSEPHHGCKWPSQLPTFQYFQNHIMVVNGPASCLHSSTFRTTSLQPNCCKTVSGNPSLWIRWREVSLRQGGLIWTAGETFSTRCHGHRGDFVVIDTGPAGRAWDIIHTSHCTDGLNGMHTTIVTMVTSVLVSDRSSLACNHSRSHLVLYRTLFKGSIKNHAHEVLNGTCMVIWRTLSSGSISTGCTLRHNIVLNVRFRTDARLSILLNASSLGADDGLIWKCITEAWKQKWHL